MVIQKVRVLHQLDAQVGTRYTILSEAPRFYVGVGAGERSHACQLFLCPLEMASAIVASLKTDLLK